MFVLGSGSMESAGGCCMLKKKRFIIGIAVVVAAIVYLGVLGFSGSTMYYYRIPELLEMGDEAYDQGLRVGGAILAGSIERGGLDVTFTVVEEGEILQVEYTGLVPDTFKDGADVVIEGKLAGNGVFVADTILMKCPSKYEAEVEE